MNKAGDTRADGYRADVCLVLEGTYPYVPGGVSTWVHNLVSSLTDLTFWGVVILPSKEQEWTPRYETPPNLKGLTHIYVHDYRLSEKRRIFPRRRKAFKFLHEFHRAVRSDRPEVFDRFVDLFYPPEKRPVSTKEMIYSKAAWKLLLQLYQPEGNEDSFIDYFWTYRFNHLPIYQVLDAPMPRAKVYHTISTGFAGLYASVAARRYDRSLILTEHGIYTKERKIEIAQAEWIYLTNRDELKIQKDLGAFQRMWIHTFEGLSRITYHVASEVITLYEGNRQIQLADGCPPEKTRIVPNGIRLEKFAGLKKEPRPADEPFHIGFVGRVVPIKDVKTFLRACKLVSLHRHDVKFFIIGPTDEDEDYFQACLALTQTLGLADKVEYTGKVDVLDYYPRLDVVCLTSVSEAQPLVIMEANCAGIPVVATDVGACSELLNGRTPEDRALGPSGLITAVADPTATAKAVLRILEDEELRRAMAEAGRERIRRFYQEQALNQTYRRIYGRYLGEQK